MNARHAGMFPFRMRARILTAFLLVFALLFAQQAGAAHALSHALEQSRQQDQGTPHSAACELCAAYAELGSAAAPAAFDLPLEAATTSAVPHQFTPFRSIPVLAAAARAPPAALHQTV